MTKSSPDQASRAVIALGVVFFGAFAVLLVAALFSRRGASEAFLVLLYNVLLVWVGGAAALVLGKQDGRGALRASLAGPAGPGWVAVGLVVGLAAFGWNWFYVEGLRDLIGIESVASEPSGSLLARLLGTAVLPSLVEEWLCRGVAWVACMRALGPRGTVVATAALFGFLHGLDGWLWVPHRFVFGLALGLLRARSGSLVPCVVAHFVNNAIVTALE